MKLVALCAAAAATLALSLVAVAPAAYALTLCGDGTLAGHGTADCRLHGGIDTHQGKLEGQPPPTGGTSRPAQSGQPAGSKQP